MEVSQGEITKFIGARGGIESDKITERKVPNVRCALFRIRDQETASASH